MSAIDLFKDLLFLGIVFIFLNLKNEMCRD